MRAAAAVACATIFDGFRLALGYPNFPWLPAVMSNYQDHSKHPPPPSNSSLKQGTLKTLTCSILSFGVVSVMFIVYMIQLIVTMQILLTLGMLMMVELSLKHVRAGIIMIKLA